MLVVAFFSISHAIDVQHMEFTNARNSFSLSNANFEPFFSNTIPSWNLSLAYDYLDDPLVVEVRGQSIRKKTIIDHMNLLHLGIEKQIFNRLSLGASTSLGYIKDVDQNTHDFGMEDFRFNLRYKWLNHKKIQSMIEPEFFIPTGSEDQYLSDEGFGYGVQSVWGYQTWKIRHTLQLGYRFNSDAEYQNIDYRHRLTTGYGLALPLNRWLVPMVEWRRFWSFESDQNPNEIFLGSMFVISPRVQLFAMAGFGDIRRLQSNQGNDVRVVGGAKFSLGTHGPSEKIDVAPLIVHQDVSPQDIKTESASQVDPCEDNRKILAIEKQMIYFEFDSSKISEDQYEKIDQIASAIKETTIDITLELWGHTDERGSEEYNKALSIKRAQVVFEAILERVKWNKDKMKVLGYSFTKPIHAFASTKQEHAINRRTEVKILD